MEGLEATSAAVAPAPAAPAPTPATVMGDENPD